MNDAMYQSLIVGGVAIFSAFIGGFLPSFLQRKVKIRELKRAKLEELYSNIERWYNFVFKNLFLHFTLVLDGHMDWNEYLDRFSERDGSNFDHVKSEIILHLYFRMLEPDYLKLKKSVQELNALIDQEIKDAYKQGGDINSFRTEHYNRTQVANADFEVLKAHMHRVAKTFQN